MAIRRRRLAGGMMPRNIRINVGDTVKILHSPVLYTVSSVTPGEPNHPTAIGLANYKTTEEIYRVPKWLVESCRDVV